MILIIDLSYEKDSLSKEEFVMPVAKLVGKCNIKHYSEIKDVSKYSRIIMCGTALRDHKSLDDIDRFDWLKTVDVPVLGICAGFQTIAKVFEEKVVLSKEIGMVRIKTMKKNRLFDGELEAYSLHTRSVDNLKNFDVLAVSDKCVHAIKHKEKEIYGILFHPEVRNERIIDNFISSSLL